MVRPQRQRQRQRRDKGFRMVTEALIHRFDIKAYHRLIADGILREDDRVELIDGRIVDMTPIGSRHSAVV